jgi:hypothetical protein
MKATADSPSSAHPWQENFEVEVGEALFHVLFPVHFGADRVPSHSRFDLQRFLSHDHAYFPSVIYTRTVRPILTDGNPDDNRTQILPS